MASLNTSIANVVKYEKKPLISTWQQRTSFPLMHTGATREAAVL